MSTTEESVAEATCANIDDIVFEQTIDDDKLHDLLKPAENTACKSCSTLSETLTLMQESEKQLLKHIDDQNRYIKGLRISYERHAERSNSLATDFTRIMAQMDQNFSVLQTSLDTAHAAYEKLLHDENTLLNRMSTIENQQEKFDKAIDDAAVALMNEKIDLPNSVDALQECVLHLREHVINSHSKFVKILALKDDEFLALSEQFKVVDANRAMAEQRISQLQNELETNQVLSDSKILAMSQEIIKQSEAGNTVLFKNITDLEEKINQLLNERKAVEISIQNYKTRCSTLQAELEVSESVQKDFVKLSQNLQVELEKIRQSGNEIRWVFEDEVSVCGGCNQAFNKTRVKVRCLHCTRLFCPQCTEQEVKVPGSSHSANVCNVCYTLLNKHATPFFADNLNASTSKPENEM